VKAPLSFKLTRRRLLAASLAVAAMSACGAPAPSRPTAEAPTAAVATNQASALPTQAPAASAPAALQRPEAVWLDFVAFWDKAQYEPMYAMVAPEAKGRITYDDFSQLYTDLRDTVSLKHVAAEIASSLINGSTAQVGYVARLESDRFGTMEQKQTVTLGRSGDAWLVQWLPSLVLPGMDYGCKLALDSTDNPRGPILDRHGAPLASLGVRVVVGVVPGQVEDEETLLATLAKILNQPASSIKKSYDNPAHPDWFMPVGELSAQDAQAAYGQLTSIPGVLLREKPVRYYPEGTTAAHLTGYVGLIREEQLSEMKSLGYRADDIIGQTGLEQSFEAQLAGKRGSRLLVMSAAGAVVTVAAERKAVPSQSLYTAIDLPLLRTSMDLLKDKKGAIVALDPRNGQVLAMASSPSFDPNMIVAGMSSKQWQDLMDNPGRPMVNRAIQSELPLGSVFKIVTESAALEAGLYTPESTFTCTGTWTGLGSGYTKTCWLLTGHGTLTLAQGLTESCDVVFYELGKALDGADREALARMAEAFGFGAKTGIDGLSEAAGLVPTPEWKEATLGESWFPGDSVNLAIGQGNLLVTPLQVANMLAAVANGGTLYRPRLVLGVGDASGAPPSETKPEVIRTLPVKAEHLKSIQDSLLAGCMSPAGTAYAALGSMTIPVAGKTGTAENPGGKPHAWFAGYAPADKPELVVAVLIENGGEGSLVAAPIFRQVVESYLQPASG
jgi:penicillin-binding protein 2